jgi:hypothetical protein
VKIHKHPLVPDRIRRPPSEGWAWIDRRFFQAYAPRLEQESLLLYVFLVSVGDKDGLSYYGDITIAGRLRLSAETVARARSELIEKDLIAFERPLYQVLSLPADGSQRPAREPTSVGDILRRVLEQGRPGRRIDERQGGHQP